MYCSWIINTLLFACAIYFSLCEKGLDSQESLLAIIIACTAAVASILIGILSYKKSVKELKETKDIPKLKETVLQNLEESKEFLGVLVDEKSSDLEKSIVEKTNILSSEHEVLLESQNRIQGNVKEIAQYAAEQSEYIKAAVKQNEDIKLLVSEIISLEKKLDEAEAKYRQLTKERDEAVHQEQFLTKELENIQLKMGTQITDLKRQLAKANETILQSKNP